MSLYGVFRMLRYSSEAPSEASCDSFDIGSPTPPQALEPLDSTPSLASPLTPQDVGTQTELPATPPSVRVGVLLDGDADYFNRTYTCKGHQGGRLAAIELKNAVERFIRKEKALSSQVRIDVIAHSFQNSLGLSKFLSDDIQAFSQGFNRSGFAFSMSDVGDEPQGADTALIAHLPILLETCDYVLFGGSHDNGYHSILSDSKSAGLFNKIILLRTTPYCAEKILELGFEEARFHPLFEGRDPTERSRRPYKPVGLERSETKEVAVANVPRPSPSIVNPAPAPSSRPYDATYDFIPLLRVLLDRVKSASPETRPLRGNIAYELGKLPKPPFDISVRGNFKRYVEEAAARGLVKLGVGEVEGTEWIEMAMPLDEATRRIQAYAIFHPRTTSERVQSASPPISPQHEALLNVLRSFPKENPTFSAVSDRMTTRGLKVWQGRWTFAEFIDSAVRAGLVESGRIDGMKHEFWIRLATPSRVATPASDSPPRPQPSSTSSHRPDIVPGRFLALVNVFIQQSTKRIDKHRLASHLSSAGHKPYETGKWNEYLDEAERLGLIRLSQYGNDVILTVQDTPQRRR